jgi:tRNA threonylcarbamoyladenosine modification (KEOPS) complex  Pcc1 subunit
MMFLTKNLNLKDKVNSNNSHTLTELKQNISKTITFIKVSELRVVLNSIFKILEICLRVEG